MHDVKCECGHTNPVGTVLCESCGKPLQEEENGQGLLPMRYEGAARRSQTYNQTLLDRVWNFFSSVKVAVWLIVITLAASAIGTIFPQEPYIPVPKPAEIYYKEAYGTLGEIYYRLGFHNLYTSWWFILLLMMIGTSLVICSLDRIIPLYRALKKQRAKRHLSFLQRQKVSAVYHLPDEAAADKLLRDLAEGLKAKKYRLLQEDSALLGEKGRFSRWGPYVNHIGLIIFLIGVLMRLIPGFYLNEYVWVREGEIKKVPETPYYVKNEKFTLEFYEEHEFPQKIDLEGGAVVKNYQTDAVLYVNKNEDVPGAKPELVEVKRHAIRVNHPLEYGDLLLYQAGQQVNQLQALNLALKDRQTGMELGKVKIDLYEPQESYRINEEVRLEIVQYFPDFAWEGDRPVTKSSFPNNPAFVVKIVGPKTPQGEKSWIFLGSTLSDKGEARIYDIAFSMPDLVDVSGLLVRKDKSLPVIYFGCFVVMVGLVMGFYWQHRRIWLQRESGGKLYIAAHTNKNWYGLKKDVEYVLARAGIHIPLDEANKGEKAK
ncbi:cytochrome c biogenesis protein ResB [Bacillaceae bacterium]